MGAPVLLGAGIGAVSSLAMGRDPLMGAALGGISGGAFGGSGGLFSGFNEGGLFTDGLFDLGLNAVEPAAQFGAVQGAEYIPTHMVDSAYGAPIGNAGMIGYQGDLGMFQNPELKNLGPVQTFGTGPSDYVTGPSDYVTGGGYDPR